MSFSKKEDPAKGVFSSPISFQEIWPSPAPDKTCTGNYRHFLLEQWSKHYHTATKQEKKEVINQLLFKNKILKLEIKSCNWMGFAFGRSSVGPGTGFVNSPSEWKDALPWGLHSLNSSLASSTRQTFSPFQLRIVLPPLPHRCSSDLL